MLKKTLVYIVGLLCCFMLAVPVWAADPNDDIMPAYLYTDILSVDGSIDMVTGELSCTTQIKTNEKCSFYITMDVYQSQGSGWKKIESFRRPNSGSYTGSIKNYTITCDVDKGYNYKVVVTAYVTSVSDGISETVKQESPVLPYK